MKLTYSILVVVTFFTLSLQAQTKPTENRYTQADIDAAMERMNQRRQVAPTTRVATRPIDAASPKVASSGPIDINVAQLAAEMADLRSEISILKAQVAQLRQQVEAAVARNAGPPAARQPSSPVSPNAPGLTTGMTLEEALKATHGASPQLVSEGSDGIRSYRCHEAAFVPTILGRRAWVDMGTITARFKSGRLVSYERQPNDRQPPDGPNE